MPAAFDGNHPASEPAPTLGGDTADVLARRLGLSADDVARLTDARTIAC
jgi:2-methylfumaryl-CoA isomerase